MVISYHYSSRVSADAYCIPQGIQTYFDGSKIIKDRGRLRLFCSDYMIPAGTLLSVGAASCAAQIIDEHSYELRTDIFGRGLLRLVDHCGGLLRLDIANAANCASLIVSIDEDSCASTYRFFVLLVECQCGSQLRFARYSDVP